MQIRMKNSTEIQRLAPRFFAAVLFFTAVLTCSACGTKAPDSLTITLNEETIDTLELIKGTEQEGITAVISPENFEGEIQWTSEDSGIVKISSADKNTCTLTAKKTGSVLIIAECSGTTAKLRVHVIKDQDNLTEADSAVTINGKAFSAETCNIYYAQNYYDFLDTYGDYASYYGLDSSGGISTLASQSCDYSEDGTWKGYFLESALDMLSQVEALCDYAEANGIQLEEEELTEIDETMAELEETAADEGFASMDTYIGAYYGKGTTADMYRTYLERVALADKTYNGYSDGLNFTDEEIEEHYAEMGYTEGENDYPLTSMRHILIMAEANEDGEYTDEAIAAAHEEAERIYEEWKNGAKTEESFAELANEYSEDGGSNTNGGLYEEIYKDEMVDGINDWLFASGRKAGDTAVIDNNGNYVGTHIVYFTGTGELYSTMLGRTDLEDSALSDWYTEVIDGYTYEEGPDYDSIGQI